MEEELTIAGSRGPQGTPGGEGRRQSWKEDDPARTGTAFVYEKGSKECSLK